MLVSGDDILQEKGAPDDPAVSKSTAPSSRPLAGVAGTRGWQAHVCQAAGGGGKGPEERKAETLRLLKVFLGSEKRPNLGI